MSLTLVPDTDTTVDTTNTALPLHTGVLSFKPYAAWFSEASLETLSTGALLTSRGQPTHKPTTLEDEYLGLVEVIDRARDLFWAPKTKKHATPEQDQPSADTSPDGDESEPDEPEDGLPGDEGDEDEGDCSSNE